MKKKKIILPDTEEYFNLIMDTLVEEVMETFHTYTPIEEKEIEEIEIIEDKGEVNPMESTEPKIKFDVKEMPEKNITIINVVVDIVSPEDLKTIEPPKVNPQHLIVISGRAPIWLYGYLIHHYHPTKAVAVYDPRLGAIIVSSHHPDYKKGDIISI